MNIQDVENRNFYTVVRLSEHIYKDNDGMLICEDAILGKAGTQNYTGRELGLDSDEVIVVERPPEEVFDEQSLASLRGKTLTLGHPEEDVDVKNHPYLAKGFVLDVRRDGNLIRGDIKVTDKEVIDLITSKEMTELSLGYGTKLKPVDGGNRIKQTEIAYNHLALVSRGRAQVAKIVDDNKTRIMDKSIEKNENDENERRVKQDMTKKELAEMLKKTFGSEKELLDVYNMEDEDTGNAEENTEQNKQEANPSSNQEQDNNPEDPSSEEVSTLIDKKIKELAKQQGVNDSEEDQDEENDEEVDAFSKKMNYAQELEKIKDPQIKDALRKELFGDSEDNSALQDFAGNFQDSEEKNDVELVDFDEEFKKTLKDINPNEYDSYQDYIKARMRIDKEASLETIQSHLEEVAEANDKGGTN